MARQDAGPGDEVTAGRRVLVVEDHPANQLLVEAVLERAGYDVDLAGDAVEARARIAAARPDVILMDVQLPGQDGLSLARELKTQPSTAAIPVIAVSAHAMSGDQAEALAAGCAGYITKPIDTRTLAGQVRQFIGRASEAAPGS
jgi:CheY-like chemotaxis protein